MIGPNLVTEQCEEKEQGKSVIVDLHSETDINSYISQRVTKFQIKSRYELAQKPFSLEASQMPMPLLKLAKRKYADQVRAKSNRI